METMELHHGDGGATVDSPATTASDAAKLSSNELIHMGSEWQVAVEYHAQIARLRNRRDRHAIENDRFSVETAVSGTAEYFRLFRWV